MEGVPFDWSDYLSSEGLSDIAPIGHDMQGGQAGQDGHYYYGKLGNMGNLETPEIKLDPVPPQQSPSPTISQTKPKPKSTTQEVHYLGELVPEDICTCAACLDVDHWFHYSRLETERRDCLSWKFGCRVTGCEFTCPTSSFPLNPLFGIFAHEGKKDHYGTPGDWRCREADCKFITKRFSDLKRHCSSKHCLKPQDLQCPDLSCKYHQIGFSRKDKLKSHCQKVHGGVFKPGKPYQPIKPKVGDSA